MNILLKILMGRDDERIKQPSVDDIRIDQETNRLFSIIEFGLVVIFILQKL